MKKRDHRNGWRLRSRLHKPCFEARQQSDASLFLLNLVFRTAVTRVLERLDAIYSPFFRVLLLFSGYFSAVAFMGEHF
jgi:hypothetical protein